MYYYTFSNEKPLQRYCFFLIYANKNRKKTRARLHIPKKSSNFAADLCKNLFLYITNLLIQQL